MSRPLVSDMREALDYIDHLEKTIKWKDEMLTEVYKELLELKQTYEGRLVSIETSFEDPSFMDDEYKKDLECSYCKTSKRPEHCVCSLG